MAALVAALGLGCGGDPEGIAWTAPEGEHVLLAGAGLAITRSEDSSVLTGRDLASGEERWRVRVPAPAGAKTPLGVHRIDALLLVHASDMSLRALDYASGRTRWRIPGAGYGPPVVRGADVFAYQRCAGACAVEVHAVGTGERRWSAVVPGATGDGHLGAPHLDPDRDPVWPSDILLLRPSLNDYEVRDIVKGKVLRRWTATDEATVVTGTTIVRSRPDGTTWGVDATTGRELWRHAGGLHPSHSPDAQGKTLAIAGGTLLFGGEREFPTYFDPDVVHTVDPASGREADVPKRIEGDVTVVDGARVFTADGAVQADGRVYKTDGLPEAAATATQVGWKTGAGAEVHDRRTGAGVVTFEGDDASVHSAGERLVITAGGRDHVVAT